MHLRSLFIGMFLLGLAACPTTHSTDASTTEDSGTQEDASESIDAGEGTDASAQDDAGENNCGDVDFIGACDGDQLLWCLSGDIFEYDCTNPNLAYAGPDRTCGLQDCTSEEDGCKGYFCVVKEGLPCDPLDPEAPALCDAASHGCLDGVCAPSEACDEETYVNSCDGDFVLYCKYRVQNIDCTQGGSSAHTCGQNSNGVSVCLGTVGGECDLARGYECVPGLTCVDGFCAP